MNLTKMLELTISARKNILNSYELENMLRQLILEEETAKAGGNGAKNRLKLAQKYIESSAKQNPHRNLLHAVHYALEKQWLCNGYSIIGLTNHITGLPEASEKLQIENIIPDSNNSEYQQLDIVIDIPALKAQAREAKAEEKSTKIESTKRIVKLGNSYFNVNLVLEALALMPGKYIVLGNTEKSNTPILIKNENDDTALIIPVRKRKDDNNNDE